MDEAKIHIEVSTTPIDRQPYRVNSRARKLIHKLLEKLEDQGVVEKGSSAWGSPISIVAKSDSSPRLCVVNHQQKQSARNMADA